GGTLKDFDLRINVKKEFFGIKKGTHWVQVKMKKEKMRFEYGYLVHLGETRIDNKLIGRDWITKRVKENAQITRWLNEMVGNYKLLRKLQKI
ncbi:MAG: hypothetical protein Q8S39_12030, partial [Ignavibacteria bacterium]|nr:hypothetical protein [Ignavibacteria bacterium]